MAIDSLIGIGIVGILILAAIFSKMFYGPNSYTEKEIERYLLEHYKIDIELSPEEYEIIDEDGKKTLRPKQKKVEDGNFVYVDGYRRPWVTGRQKRKD